MIKQSIAFLLSACCFISCTGKKSGSTDPLGDYNQHYFFYLGEDSLNLVQCVAEFRKGHEDGEYTLLPKEYVVLLDGKPLPVDTNVYPVYSEERSRETADGAHRWELKQAERSLLEIPFTFKRFRLLDTVAMLECGDADLPLRFSGLAEGDSVECWFDNTDLSNEVDRFVYPVRNGAITLRKADIERLKEGRYQLRISSILGAPVQVEGKPSGKWEASYILHPIPTRVR